MRRHTQVSIIQLGSIPSNPGEVSGINFKTRYQKYYFAYQNLCDHFLFFSYKTNL